MELNDHKHFYVSLTGAHYGCYLDAATNSQRPTKHLGYTFDNDGDLELRIYPDILFLDFEHAIDKSGLLLNKGLSLVTIAVKDYSNWMSKWFFDDVRKLKEIYRRHPNRPG